MKRRQERIGLCKACREYTSVDDSCCGAPVWFEGGWVSAEEDEDLDVDADSERYELSGVTSEPINMERTWLD